jgi:hypothetical protein
MELSGEINMKIILSKKWVDNLHGGKGDNNTPDDVDKKEFEIGKNIEFEHTSDPEIAGEIALDHMVESEDFKGNPKGHYYRKLVNMEKSIEKDKKESKEAQVRVWDATDEEAARQGGAKKRLFDLASPVKSHPSRPVGHRIMEKRTLSPQDSNYQRGVGEMSKSKEQEHNEKMDKLWEESLNKIRGEIN